ncbi:MAG TPA: His-Xaa-Ser system protein HxsD [Aquella sp.]|nr:His-Xaa-Ser system protein HxsD [Aquella sp.]
MTMRKLANKNIIADSEIIAFADSGIFSREVVLKCLYWYGDKFHIQINESEDNEFIIHLSPSNKSHLKQEELESYLYKLERDLIDFQLRDIVNKESKNVRELLIAKAFSNGEFDEEPQGVVSDPVGFDPKII